MDELNRICDLQAKEAVVEQQRLFSPVFLLFRRNDKKSL